MSEHGKYNPYKLVSHSKDGLFVGDSFGPFAEEIFSKGLVIPRHLCCHEPENTPQMSITSLGNSALSLEFPGLMDGGIKPGVSDKFFVIPKTAYIPNLGEEMEGSDISDAFNGFEDLQVLKGTLPAHLGQHIGELLQLFLKQEELGGLLGEDELSARTHRGNGILRQRDQLLRGDLRLSSPGIWLEQLGYLGGGEGFDHPGGGVMFEEVKDSFGVDIGCTKELGEGDREQLLNIIFESGDLRGKPFSLPGQFTEVGRKKTGLGQGVMEHGQEAGDGEGIFPIGFGFPKGELHEVRDEEGIDNDRMIAFVGEESVEVNVVAARGFLSDDDRVLGEFRKVLRELLESLPIHRCGEFKDLLPVWAYGACGEGILGDINPDEYLIHRRTSCKIFSARSGAASRPILHDDEGSLAQPTYHGYGRQGTDSFEGFPAQVKQSSPALPPLASMGKTQSHKTYTINS